MSELGATESCKIYMGVSQNLGTRKVRTEKHPGASSSIVTRKR